MPASNPFLQSHFVFRSGRAARGSTRHRPTRSLNSCALLFGLAVTAGAILGQFSIARSSDEANAGDEVRPEASTVSALAATPAEGQISEQGRVSTESPAQPGRFVDGEDGTITDSRTGLMWEKKCSDCQGLHDVQTKYRWSGDGKTETVWDWLRAINGRDASSSTTSGLGGHSDWRLANIKELASIVDYATFDPAADPIWNGAGCDQGCKDTSAPTCSCVASDLYWTSTTFADFPAHALVVDFAYGFVDDRLKTNRHHARAVRGGTVQADDPPTNNRP